MRGSRSAVGSIFLMGFEKAVKVVSPGGMAQLAQRLGFDLADSLARDAVQVANFLEGVAEPIDQAKAHFEDLLLASGESGENGLKPFFKQGMACAVSGVLGGLVFDEITDIDIAFVADGGVEGDGLVRHLEQ